MKKILALFVLGLGLSLTTHADDVISRNVKDLPEKAQTTLSKHFPGIKVQFITIDKELFEPTTYEARLANGTEVKFNHKGEWIEVDAKRTKVPAVFIPASIKKQATDMFPEAFIKKIEKDNRGYEVELSNGIDMKFDKKFKLRKMDD